MFDSKNVKHFQETTPKGNKIEGKILLNHGYFHGSLLIEKVNDKEALQFIRGFPKIHYFDEKHDEKPTTYIRGFEKLDGTCVGLYWLVDRDGNKIELVPKSRQRPILDEHFQEMLHYCDTQRLHSPEKHDIDFKVIYFEMFGMLNEHTLPHKNTYIDIRTIGAVDVDGITLMNPLKLSVLADRMLIPLPRRIVTITHNEKFAHSDKYYFVEINDPLFQNTVSKINTFEEVTKYIENYLDECNEIYKAEKGYLKYEGIVLQIPVDSKTFGEQANNLITTKYIKIKPKSFQEEFGESSLSVPINEIRKEIRKIINENLSTFSEDYNEKETINQINEYLSEEYSESDIKNRKTKNTIIKELHKYIDSIQDKSTNTIVDDILNNNSSKEIKELMGYFGNNYPLLKHKSGDVYFILSKRLKKGGE